MGFSGQTHMGMPILALNGTGVDILMWVYRRVPDGSHIKALFEKIRIHMYVTISNLISS